MWNKEYKLRCMIQIRAINFDSINLNTSMIQIYKMCQYIHHMATELVLLFASFGKIVSLSLPYWTCSFLGFSFSFFFFFLHYILLASRFHWWLDSCHHSKFLGRQITFQGNVKNPINFIIFMKRNWNSPREVPTRIAVGVASPSAHGQETTWGSTNSPMVQIHATLIFFSHAN